MNKVNWLAVLVENDKLSLGRVAFWMVYIVMNIMWILEKEVQESMLLVLMVLMSYNLGKKFTNIAETYFTNKQPKPAVEPNESKVEP